MTTPIRLQSSVAPVLSCAIEETLRDRSFATGSSVAADALQAARRLLLWCQDAEKEAAVTINFYNKIGWPSSGSFHGSLWHASTE